MGWALLVPTRSVLLYRVEPSLAFSCGAITRIKVVSRPCLHWCECPPQYVRRQTHELLLLLLLSSHETSRADVFRQSQCRLLLESAAVLLRYIQTFCPQKPHEHMSSGDRAEFIADVKRYFMLVDSRPT